MADDIAAEDYEELIQVRILRDGMSREQAISLAGSFDTYKLKYKLDLKSDNGKLGEAVARQNLKDRGYTRVGAKDGFYKTNINQHGFDCIYKNGDDYVIVEAKGSKYGNVVDRDSLGYDSNLRDYQMSDRWINSRIDNMENEHLISHDLAEQLRDAVIERKIRKEVHVTQNCEVTGNMVDASLMDSGLNINIVYITKLGAW